MPRVFASGGVKSRDVRVWHETDIAAVLPDVRFRKERTSFIIVQTSMLKPFNGFGESAQRWRKSLVHNMLPTLP